MDAINRVPTEPIVHPIAFFPILYYNRDMADNIIEIECPGCHASLWVDVDKKVVAQHKKTKKTSFSSFDDLLVKEKEKKQKVEERFSMARELEQAKKKKAEEIFKKSLGEK